MCAKCLVVIIVATVQLHKLHFFYMHGDDVRCDHLLSYYHDVLVWDLLYIMMTAWCAPVSIMMVRVAVLHRVV